jgi:hypothetical protein
MVNCRVVVFVRMILVWYELRYVQLRRNEKTFI